MRNRTFIFVSLGCIVLVVVIGVVAYPSLPDNIASHWDAQGDANGYLPKFFGLFLFPALMLVMFVLALVIPKVDPLKANIEGFRGAYDGFWTWVFGFFFYVYCLMIVWNLGYRFNFTYGMIPALAALWYALGVFLPKAKRNWFVGIRTPWTLSDDRVWDRAHAFGGKLFKFAALLSFGGFFFQESSAILAFVAAPAVVIALAVVVYSYVVYQQCIAADQQSKETETSS